MEKLSASSCSLENTLSIIAGKWKSVIIYYLLQRKVCRFSELQKLIPDCSKRMLALQLKDGVMGVGMGYAIATAIETGKHVVALDGDSAFGFDGMDVETMCRYNLPITVVVINNGGIYNGVDNVVPDQLGPTTLDPTARYDLIAKAFGGDNYYVTNYQEMKDTFATAVESGRPSIINVQIDPSMGKESGHIGNLNTSLNLKPLEEAEQEKIDKE